MGLDNTPDENEPKHQRRIRYKGAYPKNFKEKYKELHPERYADDVVKIIQKGNTPAGIMDTAEGLHAFQTLGAQMIAGTVEHRRRLLGPLQRHGGRHVERLETRVVRRIHRLGVGDSGPESIVRQLLAHVLDTVQSLTYGALASGMQVRVEAGPGRLQQ